MYLSSEQIQACNEPMLRRHQQAFAQVSAYLQDEGLQPDDLIAQIQQLQIAIPSWALGTGGTRFGRFPIGESPVIWKKKLKTWVCCMR